jgi:hypothetical protein
MAATEALAALTNQALENLVNQFARPLDCLRELVQNALDAGSPRVEVAIDFAPDVGDVGILTIEVRDHGEGMSEEIIDNQLTRLFSSTKEGDLTRIGKFGIGFTSVFAIRPDAVLVQTGRDGESWELLFRPDRTFEKVRSHLPMTGTRVSLYRRGSADQAADVAREAEAVLRYWCEHAHRPILFTDRRVAAPGAEVDPFAAFAAEPPATSIARPFDLPGCTRVERSEEPGLIALVGVGARPMYGFYNAGLTLVRGDNPDVLGAHAPRLRHLAFKVRHDRLEHTLTRDNVLQDRSWERALQAVVALADRLRDRLVADAEAACADGRDLEELHALLLDEARACPDASSPFQSALRDRRLFRGHDGPVALADGVVQEWRLGGVLLHPGPGPLADALAREGWRTVSASATTRALIHEIPHGPVAGWLLPRRRTVDATSRFALPRLPPAAELGEVERELFARADRLLRAATSGRASVVAGDFDDEAHAEDLLLEGPRDGALFERRGDGWRLLPAYLSWRTLMVGRRHPLVRTAVSLGRVRPSVAAAGLVQALLTVEGLEPDSTFEAVLAAAERLGEGS